MKHTLILLVLALVGPQFVRSLAAKPTRPNILYFYVDDLGWGSIGPNGQADRRARNLPNVKTPNLDRLAAQGVNFTRGYGCHVCSPARSSQQSGFHQGHTYADRNDPDNARKAMRADDLLMGDVLSAAGYTTGYWGKWGYGGSKDMQNPVIDNVQTLPTSHGYQYVLAELHHVRAHTFFQPTLWSAPAAAGATGGIELIPNSMAPYMDKAKYPEMPAMQHHAKYPKTAYCDDTYAFAALDFVREQGVKFNQSGQPFFGLFAAQIPHAPFDEISKLPGWSKAYANDRHFSKLAKQSQQWAAMVTRIDAHFGNILAALEDPNQDGNTDDSIVDNTLVIFQSDNGGPGGKSNGEFDANGGLSGTKGKIQEGGIRVPLIMRWPAAIRADSTLKQGSNNDMVVDVTDLLPTFCELAGTPIPLGIDGVSIAPTLTGQGHQRSREFLIHEAGNGQSIIRGKHKLVRSSKGPLKLYDLEVDPAEQKNIAQANKKLVKELQALLLGERVAEPKGFANTYHHWEGKDGAKTSQADNWSDYVYANAGVTYMTDAGAPHLSWVTRVENKGQGHRTANVDADLECLALQISGNGANAQQHLVLASDVNLMGRNEIRVGAHGALVMNEGTVTSLRWVDIQPSGTLSGAGTIDATLYNTGAIRVGDASLKVAGDFHQLRNGVLRTDGAAIEIAGMAHLDGSLALDGSVGKKFTVLKAKNITGRFSNDGDVVVASDDSTFAIEYSKTTVKLRKQ